MSPLPPQNDAVREPTDLSDRTDKDPDAFLNWAKSCSVPGRGKTEEARQVHIKKMAVESVFGQENSGVTARR